MPLKPASNILSAAGSLQDRPGVPLYAFSNRAFDTDVAALLFSRSR
jgi:hypothetical protein